MYCDDHNDKSPELGVITFINYKEVMKSYVGLNGPSSPQDKIFACPADILYYDETSIYTNMPIEMLVVKKVI